jgi:hypothetical protein
MAECRNPSPPCRMRSFLCNNSAPDSRLALRLDRWEATRKMVELYVAANDAEREGAEQEAPWGAHHFATGRA